MSQRSDLRDIKALTNNLGRGRIFYLDSVNGAAGNSGTSPDYAVVTLSAAHGLCTAGRGDVIVALPGHAETFSTAAAVTLSKDGVSLVGIGQGSDKPSFTFGTLTTAGIVVSGNNIKIKNVLGIAGLDALTKPFQVTGDDAELDIEWRDGSATVEAATVIDLDTANRAKVNLLYRGFTGGNAAVRVIRIDDCDDVDITIDAYGVVSTAWVNMVDVASTNVKVRGRTYTSGIATGARNVVDTITGSTWDAQIFDAAAGSSFSGGSAAALAADDVSVLVAGAPFAIQSTVVSSAIPNNTQTGGAITAAAGGPVIIEDVIFETNATGVVAPTNIEITTDNVSGLTGVAAPLVLQAVAGLGANKTVVAKTTSTTKILPFTLESGKKLFISGDDAAGTGAGTVRITILCRKVLGTSTLTAVNLP